MPKGFFVTGTDTGVGKTIIAAALIKASRLLGFNTCGMKPIETGCRREPLKVQRSEFNVQDESLTPSDGIFLKEMAGMEEPIGLVTPVRFESPVAPLPASEIEGKPVDIERIEEAFFSLAGSYDAVIVEGVGGLLVPITREFFVVDLARRFGLPIIAVSRPGLGAINHTMLTVECAVRRGLTVVGIILNYTHPPERDLAERTNPEVISKISPIPLMGIFPCLGDLEGKTIEQAAMKNLDLGAIRRYL